MNENQKHTPLTGPGLKRPKDKARSRKKAQEDGPSAEFVEGYRHALEELAKAALAQRSVTRGKPAEGDLD